MTPNIRFARLTFLIAGIWGVIVIVPGFFTEKMVGSQYPPAITHPEYYYGFYGTALAWQIAFLILATDPLRLRPFIPAAIAEKLVYGGAIAVLFVSGRVPTIIAVFGGIDLLFGVFFLVAYFRLGRGEQAIAQAH